MKYSNLDKNRSWANLQPRSHSPIQYRPKNSFVNPSNSVHSQHLWNMMEDIDLFPDQIQQLLRYEDRNLSNYKKSIEREKLKVNHEIQNFKKDIIHNIDDLKISIFAELDRIYKFYMQKYATLKGEIMQVKLLKDELQIGIDHRSNNFIPKYTNTNKDVYQSRLKNTKFANGPNANIMKSLELNNYELKKYQMINYIAELQREKILPLGQLSKELIILTQYDNGYYQNKEFAGMLGRFMDGIKDNLRSAYQKKYQFIRDPETLIRREETPILEGIYQQIPNNYKDIKRPFISNVDQLKSVKVSQSQQIMSLDWAQDIKLSPVQTLKTQSNHIILCALEVKKNFIAVGGKEGVITVYDYGNGQKVASLRAHKASICTLALINYNGKQYLASGSDHGCSSIALWDLSTWSILTKIQAHTAAVTAIVDLNDNHHLISGSYDKKLNVYNLNNEGKIQYNLPTNKSSVTGIILNCNGGKMVSCGLDNTLNVWQVVRGGNRVVETIFLERIIQNNTMICSLVGSLMHENVIYIGAKDGKIKLINIDRGEAYKAITVCNNAVIQMVVIERQTKPYHPIIVVWPCKEQCMKVVNCESGKVTNLVAKGFIQFGCGIGPKGFLMKNGRTIGMLSQSQTRKEVNFFNLDIVN